MLLHIDTNHSFYRIAGCLDTKKTIFPHPCWKILSSLLLARLILPHELAAKSSQTQKNLGMAGPSARLMAHDLKNAKELAYPNEFNHLI